MDKYNYLEEMVEDIVHWMDNDLFDLSQFRDRDDAAEYLNNILWGEDEITGNGPYGYASENISEEFLCHNLDLLFAAISDFDGTLDPFQLRSYIDNHRIARYLDCTIRCYLLPEAIDKALREWEIVFGNSYKGD